MNKLKNWFLKVYENQDIAIKRKSLYTLYFVFLSFVMIIPNFIIEFINSENIFFEAVLSSALLFIIVSFIRHKKILNITSACFLVLNLFFTIVSIQGTRSIILNFPGVFGLTLTILFHIRKIGLMLCIFAAIRKGQLRFVAWGLTFTGITLSTKLLIHDTSGALFFPYVMLGVIMASMIHTEKIDFYITISFRFLLINSKLIFLALTAKNKIAQLQVFYLSMTFMLFFVLAFLITKIINDEITRSRDLIISNNELEKSNKAKIDFISNVSHELRTPLNGIIGTTELITFNENSLRFKNDLNTILNSAKHLLALINQVLDISKINHESFKLQKSFYSLEKLINEVETMFRAIANQKKLTFYVFHSQKISEYIYVDYFKLKQVLINLLSNAFKFTDSGYVALYVEHSAATTGKEEIRFVIEDSGIGISKEDQKNIFDAFRQGQVDLAKQYEGTGLGLSISNKIIENMHSHINIDSNVGVGSKFYFDLLCNGKNPRNTRTENKKEALIICQNAKDVNFISKCLNDININYLISEDIEEAEDYILELSDDTFIFLLGEDNKKKLKSSSILNNYDIFYFNSYSEKGSSLLLSQTNINSIIQCKDKDEENCLDYANHNIKKFQGIRALIVEDNIINSNIMSRFLEISNIESDIASNSTECLALIEDNIYDIIFLDIQLPKTSGFDILKIIKSRVVNKAKFVAFTASISEDFRNKCLKQGFDDFIAKPFTYSDLDRVLKKYFSFNFDSNKIEEDSFYKEMLLILKKDYSEKLEEIKIYLRNNNFEQIEKLSHYMKSGAGTIQQFDLHKHLINLEQFAKNKNKAASQRSYEFVYNELQRIGDKL